MPMIGGDQVKFIGEEPERFTLRQWLTKQHKSKRQRNELRKPLLFLPMLVTKLLLMSILAIVDTSGQTSIGLLFTSGT